MTANSCMMCGDDVGLVVADWYISGNRQSGKWRTCMPRRRRERYMMQPRRLRWTVRAPLCPFPSAPLSRSCALICTSLCLSVSVSRFLYLCVCVWLSVCGCLCFHYLHTGAWRINRPLIGHLQPCMTEIDLHIAARMGDYIATHPYIPVAPLRFCRWFPLTDSPRPPCAAYTASPFASTANRNLPPPPGPPDAGDGERARARLRNPSIHQAHLIAGTGPHTHLV
eukprot:COSAG05_NODE_2215_length_3380_cov_6.954282_5_plen_224_part_00